MEHSPKIWQIPAEVLFHSLWGFNTTWSSILKCSGGMCCLNLQCFLGPSPSYLNLEVVFPLKSGMTLQHCKYQNSEDCSLNTPNLKIKEPINHRICI